MKKPHKKCLTHRLDGNWEWCAVVWFGDGMFANCEIKHRTGKSFGSKREAEKDMDNALFNLGVIETASEYRHPWWNKEITTWLNKLRTPKKFLEEYSGACASYEWKQLCIERAIKRWPSHANHIAKFRGKC